MNIETVYNLLEDLGLVSSQRAFSTYMDRSESWMSTSLARSRTTMTVENLFRLAVRLEESVKRTKAAIEKETDADQAQLYRDGVATMSKLRDEIMLEITGRVKGKA